MNTNLENLRKQTKELLGEDADLSYLTEELLQEMSKAQFKEVEEDPKYDPETKDSLRWEKEGNTVSFDGTKTKWRDQCSLTAWWSVDGRANTKRVVNCANNLLKYKIWM